MTDVETAVEGAVQMLRRRGGESLKYKVSPNCMRMISNIMMEGEEPILDVRQSYLSSISPDRIIVTNKRVIIVRPSFWGLYFGMNIFHTTEVSAVSYTNIISILTSHGKIFSSIHMRIHGFADATTSSLSDEGKLDGVSTVAAINLSRFIEHVTNSLQHPAGAEEEQPEAITGSREITLAKAKEISNSSGTKFIWLGVEPLLAVSKTLGVPRDRIMYANGMGESADINALSYSGSVLVCYDGSIARRLAKHLKETYDVDAYVLSGGIAEAAKASAMRGWR